MVIQTTFRLNAQTADENIHDHGRWLIHDAINHVLAHGWQLLHVGAEFGQDEEGKSVSHTVAILGKPVS